MKGFFLALMLVALLVVGILVVKNLGEHRSDKPGETDKIEVKQQAEKTADEVKKKFDALKKKTGEE